MSKSTLSGISTQMDADIDELDEAEKYFSYAKNECSDIKKQLDEIINSMDEYWKGNKANEFKNRAKKVTQRVYSHKEYNKYILKKIQERRKTCEQLKEFANKFANVFGA